MYDLYGDPTDISGARDDAQMEMKPTADPRERQAQASMSNTKTAPTMATTQRDQQRAGDQQLRLATAQTLPSEYDRKPSAHGRSRHVTL